MQITSISIFIILHLFSSILANEWAPSAIVNPCSQNQFLKLLKAYSSASKPFNLIEEAPLASFHKCNFEIRIQQKKFKAFVSIERNLELHGKKCTLYFVSDILENDDKSMAYDLEIQLDSDYSEYYESCNWLISNEHPKERQKRLFSLLNIYFEYTLKNLLKSHLTVYYLYFLVLDILGLEKVLLKHCIKILEANLCHYYPSLCLLFRPLLVSFMAQFYQAYAGQILIDIRSNLSNEIKEKLLFTIKNDQAAVAELFRLAIREAKTQSAYSLNHSMAGENFLTANVDIQLNSIQIHEFQSLVKDIHEVTNGVFNIHPEALTKTLEGSNEEFEIMYSILDSLEDYALVFYIQQKLGQDPHIRRTTNMFNFLKYLMHPFNCNPLNNVLQRIMLNAIEQNYFDQKNLDLSEGLDSIKHINCFNRNGKEYISLLVDPLRGSRCQIVANRIHQNFYSIVLDTHPSYWFGYSCWKEAQIENNFKFI